MRTGGPPLGMRVTRPRHMLLLALLAAAFTVPAVGILLAVEAAQTIGLGQYDFVLFIAVVAVLGGTSVIVGAAITWRVPGNRIGLVMVLGGMLLMSVFTAWPISIVREAAGDAVASGLYKLVGNCRPAARHRPDVPDRRDPVPRRAAARSALARADLGLRHRARHRHRAPDDRTMAARGRLHTPHPLAIAGVPVELSELGGDLAALGTFLLFAIAAVAVVVRLRRSTGVEHAQQKWLVASVVAIAIAFPLSFATSFGPDALIDLLSVVTGALVPIAWGSPSSAITCTRSTGSSAGRSPTW